MNKTFIRSLVLLAAMLLAFAACKKTPAPTHSDWTFGTVVYEMNTRQLTPEGTFAAAEAHLPRLKALGVDIIWLMPIYPIGELERKGSLGSYYAIRDYCDVNPEFGTLADFDHFLAEAHSQGFKVILDWVANHTSPDHPWVTEKPADWYHRDADGKTIVEYDWTDIAKLNYAKPEMRKAMEKSMRFWLDRGVDGFRCDVAYQVPADFWKSVLPKMRKDYKDMYFLAEGEEVWLHGAGFDATYAWELHHLLNDIAQGNAGVAELEAYLEKEAADYPKDAFRLGFTSNHDENSWNGTEFERMGLAWRAMTVLAYTLPGMQPLIYTGQEVGYDHRFEFFEKDPVPAELWNDPEAAQKFTSFYKSLTDLYHSHPALWAGQELGTFEIVRDHPFAEGMEDVFVYRRSLGGDIVTVGVHLVEPFEFFVTIGDEEAILEENQEEPEEQ